MEGLAEIIGQMNHTAGVGCLQQEYRFTKDLAEIRAVDLVNRLFCPAAEAVKHFGIPLMSSGVTGIEFKGLSKLRLAAGKIPIDTCLVGSQDRMWARKGGIEFQGFACRGVSFGYDLLGVFTVTAKNAKRIRQACVGQRISGIFVDRLLK